MSKRLDNDQLLKKAHKEVQNLGVLASTVLLVEVTELISRRIAELKKNSKRHPHCNLVHKDSTLKVLNLYLNNIIFYK